MIVNIKYLGKRKNSIQEIPFHLKQNPNTIAELINETVKLCVANYQSGQEKKQVLEALSKTEIEDRAAGGKISFGINYGEGLPDLEKATSAARQAFEDGLVVIFVDGVEKCCLQDIVDIKDDTKVTFVRMTMLSGRMW